MTPSAIVTDELGSIDLILRARGVEAQHLRVPTCGFRHDHRLPLLFSFKTPFAGGAVVARSLLL